MSFLGYNPALASSQTLPTLPFTILQRLLTLHPVATTTGASIRQTALDTGVVHLLLTCLGLLSHHKPRNTDTRHESTMEALKAFNAKYVRFDVFLFYLYFVVIIVLCIFMVKNHSYKS